jgi:hypothetical protein
MHANTHEHTHVTFRPEFRPRWWLLSGLDSVTYQASRQAILQTATKGDHQVNLESGMSGHEVFIYCVWNDDRVLLGDWEFPVFGVKFEKDEIQG